LRPFLNFCDAVDADERQHEDDDETGNAENPDVVQPVGGKSGELSVLGPI
jgi:hypothetical protein